MLILSLNTLSTVITFLNNLQAFCYVTFVLVAFYSESILVRDSVIDLAVLILQSHASMSSVPLCFQLPRLLGY
jgi:hypothetical protein